MNRLFPTGFLHELREMAVLAGPMVITQLLQMTLGPMSLIFCGRLGAIQLACAALSSSLINVTGLTVVFGLSAACDTLYTQTYGSVENRHKLGMLAQRGVLLLLLCLMPCFALHVNAERFLLAMGQDPVVSHLCGEYMQIAVPGIAAFSVYYTLSKYIQCQNRVMPVMLIGVLANVVAAVLHYVLMFEPLQLGTNGSVYAVTGGYVTLLILTVLYIMMSGMYKDTWTGLDTDCFLHWGQFFRLSYAGLFMIGFEWWSFEVGIFLAGVLGTVQLDAQSIVFQIETLVYMLPMGVGFAASIRVGQYLGQGNSDGAKSATRVALAFIACLGFVVGIFLGGLRFHLPKIFSIDDSVIDLAAQVFPILAFYMIFDSINGVGCGILRGMGRQSLGSFLIFTVYLIALLSGVPTLLLSPLGIKGYWICLAVSIMAESLLLSGILFRVDWDNEVQKAAERTTIAAAPKNSHHHDDEKLHGHHENGDVIGLRKIDTLHVTDANDTTALLNGHVEPHKKESVLLSRCIIICGFLSTFLIGIIVRITHPPDPIEFNLEDYFNANVTIHGH